jgi:outer membrane biosynthesis protein TonB
MSAQQGAPGLGRAQMATPTFWNAPQGSSIPMKSRPARMTRRAMAVAAATLCAPAVAAIGLAAIAAAGGGGHPEMGSLAGTQGLRGTTVAATAPAPAGVLGPSIDDPKAKPVTTDEDNAAAHKRHPTQDTSSDPQRAPAPTTRAPAHKPPTHAAPQPPPSKVNLNPPAPAPTPSVDPTTPGAPTSGSTSGAEGGGDTSGSSSGSSSSGSSTSGSSSGSNSGPGSPEGPYGQSGGD